MPKTFGQQFRRTLILFLDRLSFDVKPTNESLRLAMPALQFICYLVSRESPHFPSGIGLRKLLSLTRSDPLAGSVHQIEASQAPPNRQRRNIE